MSCIPKCEITNIYLCTLLLTTKRMVLDNLIVIYGCLFFIICINGHRDHLQDKTTRRPNTLYDDADDIQPQLDNEARDKAMFGKPKTIFIFRLPTPFPSVVTVPLRRSKLSNYFARRNKCRKTKTPKKIVKDWTFKDQDDWSKEFPACGGRSQSPVDLPYTALVKAKGYRQLMYLNYDVLPRKLIFSNDGKRLMLHGEWESTHQPLIYGGAAHNRRYVFNSLTLHFPSEHRIGGLAFPLETQVIFISAEYKSFDEALKASAKDGLAFLGISNLYKFGNHTHQGLADLLNVGFKRAVNSSLSPLPLSFFSPPLRQYACYQGSLTFPPCTESVLWMVRARALPVTRNSLKMAQCMLEKELIVSVNRQPQPLNDRQRLAVSIVKEFRRKVVLCFGASNIVEDIRASRTCCMQNIGYSFKLLH